MDCPTCNRPAAAGARFCLSCGAQLGAPDDTGRIEPVGATDATSTGRIPVVPVVPEAPAAAPAVVEPPMSTGDVRACPSCGATNSVGRVLCATCGVDLDTGRQHPSAVDLHAPGPSVDVVGDVDVADAPTRSRTAGIVGAIVVLSLVLGAVLGIWLAGRDTGDEDQQAVFDAAVYPGDPSRLTVTGVGVSSVLPSTGGVTYGRENLVDDDLTTWWSHDPATEAATDVDIVLGMAEAAWVTDVIIGNGAQGDDLAFAADGRVVRLALVVDGVPVVELQLLDQVGLQQVTLPEPQLLSDVRLVVREAVPGDTYDEISLSEIQLLGHIAIGEDRTRASGERQPTDG